MAEMVLEFYVKDQTLVRKKDGLVPRTDSENYLYLKFNFVDDSWSSLTGKKVWIGNVDEIEYSWTVSKDTDFNKVKVPDDYLKRNFFLVTLQGVSSNGTSILTNTVKIVLPESGGDNVEMGQLPPSGEQEVTDIIAESLVAAEAAKQAAQQAIGVAPTITLEEVREGVKITVKNPTAEVQEQSYTVKDVDGNGTYVQSEEPLEAADGAIWIDTDEDAGSLFFIQDEEPLDAKDGTLWIDTDENPPEIEVDIPEVYDQEEEPTDAKEGDFWIDKSSFLKEVDPTVPKWAKQPTKPRYTAAEVGAASPVYVHNAIQEAMKNLPSGGEKEWRLLADIDFSLEENQIQLFTWTDLGGVTDIFMKINEVQNGSTTTSGYDLSINGKKIAQAFAPSQKSGTVHYWWAAANYDGLVWNPIKTNGTIDGNWATMGTAVHVSYNKFLGVGAAEEISLHMTNATYKNITGTWEIWVR